MPTFDTTQVNYEIPIDNRLGDFGVSFDVGKVVWIASADNTVNEVFSIKDPTDINLAKVLDAGTEGEFGKCIFRRGKTYNVSSAIQFILEQAGYTTVGPQGAVTITLETFVSAGVGVIQLTGTVAETLEDYVAAAAGAYEGIEIDPGNSIQTVVDANPAGTTYVLTTGTHTQQSVTPKTGDTFIGQTGTILDGEDVTARAFRSAGGTADDVTISTMEIKNYTQDRTGVVQSSDNSGWTFTDLEVHDNLASAGIQHGPNATLTRCHVHHNRTGILSVGTGADGSVVDDCEVSFNNHLDTYDSGDEAGGSKWLKTDGMTVKNCHFHDNHDNGIWFDADNLNIIIEDNLCEDNLGNGIFYEISYGPTVIRNNDLLRNAGAGVRVSSSSDVEVHGNTMVAESTIHAFFGLDADRGSGALGELRVTGLNFHDNTVTVDSGAAAGVRDNFGTEACWGAPAANVFSNNTYFSQATDVFWWVGNVKHNFATWQGYGHDATGSRTGV